MKNRGSEVSRNNPREIEKPGVLTENKNKHFERHFNQIEYFLIAQVVASDAVRYCQSELLQKNKYDKEIE